MQGTILCANPIVAVYDDVFDKQTADTIIELGREGQEQAQIGTMTGRELSPLRTGTAAYIDNWSHPALTDLVLTLSSLVRLPPEHSEHAKLLHYEGTQSFELHRDGFDQFSPASFLRMRDGGQRLFTTLCYLTDVEGGGETIFPDLKVAITPRLGRVLVFANTVPGKIDPHPHALHIGSSLTSGEKWALSVFWREHIWHEARDYPAEEGDILTF